MKSNIVISEESGCVIKDECVSEEVMQMENFSLKELSNFSAFENTKDNVAEADPNLEGSLTVCQGIEMMFINK